MSIDAKELRIGNWVVEYDDMPTQMAADMFVEPFISRIKPIPLTPEILIACGFRHDEPKEEKINYSIGLPIGNGSDLFIEFDPLFDGQINVGINNATNFNYFYDGLKYLHQLQNLIHSLTGKEIEYKP